MLAAVAPFAALVSLVGLTVAAVPPRRFNIGFALRPNAVIFGTPNLVARRDIRRGAVLERMGRRRRSGGHGNMARHSPGVMVVAMLAGVWWISPARCSAPN